jgi:hypothetical protein
VLSKSKTCQGERIGVEKSFIRLTYELMQRIFLILLAKKNKLDLKTQHDTVLINTSDFGAQFCIKLVPFKEKNIVCFGKSASLMQTRLPCK